MFDMGTVAATERIVPPQRNEITIEVITPEKKAGGNGSALRPRSEGLSCEEKHFVRGRLRIGVPPLAGRRDLLDRLGKYVATLPGVRSVDASGLCNQLTVGYDHQVIRKTDIIGTIEAMTVGDLEKLTDEALAAAAAPAEEEKDVRQTVPQEVCYLEKNEAIAASRLACIPIHSMKGRLRIAVPLLATYEGMAESLREWLLARPGVTEVSSNYRCGSFTIQYEAQITKSDEILRALDDLTVGDLAAMRAELPPKVIEDQDISFSYFKTSTFAMGLSLVVGAVPAIAFGVIYPILVSVSIPVFIRAYRCLKNERRFNVDFLDAAALTAAMLTGDVINASAMVWLIHLGDNIRDRTASSSQRTIRKLLDFQDNYAWVVRDKVEVQIRVRDIVEGDVVALHVGNLIPVDGEVLEGELIVDQQVLTGESMPVCKEVGDTVLASTVIRDGKAYVKVLRTGDKTKVAQVVRAVEEAPVYETKIQNHAEKMADRLVFPSLVLTTLVFLPTLNLYHLAAMLTVDFGTGIRVSAPTAVLSSMIAAVSQGILIKGGSYLEKLCQVDTIVFDKTGTLTTGVIKVEDTFTFNGYAEDELLAFAATAELQMTHPIAQAVVNHAEERGLALKQRDDVKYCVGRGVDAQIEGKRIMVGESAVAAGGFHRDRSDRGRTDRQVHERREGLPVCFHRQAPLRHHHLQGPDPQGSQGGDRRTAQGRCEAGDHAHGRRQEARGPRGAGPRDRSVHRRSAAPGESGRHHRTQEGRENGGLRRGRHQRLGRPLLCGHRDLGQERRGHHQGNRGRHPARRQPPQDPEGL